MGHFVYFCFPDHSNRVVGQLLQWSNRSPNNAVMNMYLPLYHPGTQQHINNPLILPRPISHGSLEGGTELVQMSLITEVSPESIDGFAFVFCYSNVKSYSIHIQGMMDAFVVRFKHCSSSRCLVKLTEDEFFPFPDKYPLYQNRWSDCIGRVIFDSIDDIHQEMWRILCKWGQYQGDFPKA